MPVISKPCLSQLSLSKHKEEICEERKNDDTNKIFTNPSKKETEDYITGKFG